MKSLVILHPFSLWLFFMSFSCSLLNGEGSPLECPNFVITEARDIQSPLFNEGYFEHFRCWYNITAPEGQRIKIQFSVFSLPPSKVREHINYHLYDEGCQTDYVQLWESEDAKEPTGRFCGNELEGKSIETRGNKLKIVFQSFITDKAFKGFSARISFVQTDHSICGNIINTEGTFEMGQIKSGKTCQFTVKAPIGKLPHVNPLAINGESGCSNLRYFQDNGYGKDNNLRASKLTSCKPNLRNKKRKQKNVQLVNYRISLKESVSYSGKLQVSFIDPVLFCGGEIRDKATISSKDVLEGRYVACAWSIKKESTTDSLTLNVITDLEEPENIRSKDSTVKICMKDQVLAFAYSPDPASYTKENWKEVVSEPICGKNTKQFTIQKLDRNSPSHYVTVMSIMTFEENKDKSISFSVM